MQTWYECKVKYMKIDEGGFERKVNDNYLVDAVSFTDAEARIFFQMQQITRGDFQLLNIKKSNITEILTYEDGEWWYKAKINLITIDEEKGKEKKVSNYVLVMANDIEQALKRLNEGMSYMLVPYATVSIQLSSVVDVFPYFEDEKLQSTGKPEASSLVRELTRENNAEELQEQEEIADTDNNEEFGRTCNFPWIA